jgi:hypothetical protein
MGGFLSSNPAKAVGGAAADYMTGGLSSTMSGGYAGQANNALGNEGTHAGDAVGLNNPAGKSAAAAQQQSIQNQQAAEQGVFDTEAQQGQQYYGGVADAANKYANTTQDNTTTYKQNMQNALTNWQTPNNATEQGIQGMYNQQAQGITTQGLADYGVLAALGGQATANTIGSSGQPITGGQMQAIQGANMSQAGNEFANAQAQASGLQAQGLSAGLNQNNMNYANVQNENQAAFGADQGAAATQYDTQSGLAGLQYGIQQQGDQNNMGMINQKYGAQQQADIAQAQAANAAQAGKLGAIGSIAGGAGGVAASYFGGGGGLSSMMGGGGGGGGGGGYMQSAAQGAALGQQQAGLVGQGSGNQVYTTPGPGGYNQSPSYGSSGPQSSGGGGGYGGGGQPQVASQPNAGPSNTGIYEPGASFPQGSPYTGPSQNNGDIAPGDQNQAHYNPYGNYV